MKRTPARRLGLRRANALLLGVALVGGMFVPTVALAAGPSVTVNQASGQADPANRSPINFTFVFSKPVQGFTGEDVGYVSSAGGTPVITVTGGPETFNVAFAGMTRNGEVRVFLPAGAVLDLTGMPNLNSTSVDNLVEWWVGPLVTVTAAAAQANPANVSPINFTVKFSDPIQGFTSGDVIVSGTAGGPKVATVDGEGQGTTFNVAVAGMTTAGYVKVSVPAGAADNPADEPNHAATVGGFGVFWWPGPFLAINPALGQADPTNVSPINFTAEFSESVHDFTSSDVIVEGSAGGLKTASVSGGPKTYNIAVSGMTTLGSVHLRVPAGAALTAAGQTNLDSTSTDHEVIWMPAAQSGLTLTTSAPIPPGAQLPTILWGQGFTLGVEFGTTGANRAVLLEGTRDGTAWTPITTLTTDAVGHASLLYRPVTNLFYRAVFAGAPDLAAVTSNEVRTVVRQLAVMRPTNAGSTKTISRNGSITFSTTVRPSRPELAPATVTFSFYRQVSASWRLATSRAVAVDSAGVARTTFQFTTVGQWYVRSQAGPTPYNANSVPTPIERYSVR